jgi:hypothetical protein
LAVAGGTLVAFGLGAEVVALGFAAGVLVALGTGVLVAGTGVFVAGTAVAVAVGVMVGVGDGGPGGGGIGVGTIDGGGGGVLAAANVCSDALRIGLLTMISPAVNGTATSRDKRLFIQDSLRVGLRSGRLCAGNIGLRHNHYRCAICQLNRASHRSRRRGKPILTWLSASPLSLTQRLFSSSSSPQHIHHTGAPVRCQ